MERFIRFNMKFHSLGKNEWIQTVQNLNDLAPRELFKPWVFIAFIMMGFELLIFPYWEKFSK